MRFLILLIIFCSSISLNAQTSDKIKSISPKKIERKLNKDIQLLDVRTPKEFNENCIGKAKNINIEGSTFEQEAALLDKKKPVYVYCRSGKRSNKAAKKLVDLGFKKVYDLNGGVLAFDEYQKSKSR